MIKNQTLKELGYIQVTFPIDNGVENFIIDQNWKALDDFFLQLEKPQGLLFNFLSTYLDFDFTEHIIAIRSAPEDEDGIWHDDGSRFIGYSLSLNLDPKSIQGGELRFKEKSSSHMTTFPPLPYGEMVVFLSGVYGFEHMVSSVQKGQRIVIAGWCW